MLKDIRSLSQALSLALCLLTVATLNGPVALAQSGATPTAEVRVPCDDGRLHVRDLAGADATLADGLNAANEKAVGEFPDAQLYTLRLVCPLLETGYQWQGTYFSKEDQIFYSTDTGAKEASEDDPASYIPLDTTGLRFSDLYLALQRAGFNDDLALGGVGGVTVQTSTEAHCFGPPTAPLNAIYFHVAILQQGEVIDVWVGAADGTIYRYESGQDSERPNCNS